MTPDQVVQRLSPDGPVVHNGSGWLVRCPAHEDQSPSLSVDTGRNGVVLLRCFAGCSVESIVAAAGLRMSDLFQDAATRIQRGHAHRPPRREPSPPPPSGPSREPQEDEFGDDAERRSKREQWPEFSIPNRRELEQLATLRNLTVPGLQLAVHRGLLVTCEWRGARCWCLLDYSRRVGQVRRLDGLKLRLDDGRETKAQTLPGSLAAIPLGLPVAESFPCVLVVEGGPDLIAAHTFIHAEGRVHDTAAVAMLGASLSVHPAALPGFCGKRVRAFPHADEAGIRGVAHWLSSLMPHAAHMDVARLEGLVREDGGAVKDLNDLTSISVATLTAHPWLNSLCPGPLIHPSL